MNDKTPVKTSNIAMRLGGLIVVFAFALNWFLEQEETTDPGLQRNDPDFYLRHATINRYGESGELRHTLAAQRFTHYPVTDLTAMDAPTLSLAHASPTSPWEITSEQGRILRATDYRSEVVEFWDKVKVSRGGDQYLNIQAESLTVYPDRAYAETDTRVAITSQSGQTSAGGMKAYFDEDRFIFTSSPQSRVTTTLLTTQDAG